MPDRILFLTDWLPPDFGAVGQYTLQRAQELARQGHQVLVIGLGTEQIRSGPSLGSHSSGTLRVERLVAKAYDKSRLGSRIRWTMGVNFRLLRRAFGAMRKADRVILTGHPPLLLHWIAPFKLLMKGTLEYRICDFHPECLTASMAKVTLGLRLVTRVTWFWRRRVDRFEALGEDMKQRLIAGGISPDKIVVDRDGSPVEFQADTQPLEMPAALRGQPVLLYSGNFGIAHDAATFVEGYARHHQHHSNPVTLWLNATGEGANVFQKILEDRGLPVYRTHPVPLTELASLLCTPEAHLITLRDEFVGLVLPSKVYACVASGRPVLFVGSRSSDVHLLCQQGVQSGSYFHVAVGDEMGLAKSLDEIADRYFDELARAGSSVEHGGIKEHKG